MLNTCRSAEYRMHVKQRRAIVTQGDLPPQGLILRIFHVHINTTDINTILKFS